MSPEIKAKAAECTSPEELIELAKSEGIELTDEQIDAISGGVVPEIGGPGW
ncbi:MAG: Nif11-like leader peptide family natural product precursor [Atopobiaceae bacterium]|nr:Nif11-like leader peptide family natural product precursor [Atopobiaceae bacterium]